MKNLIYLSVAAVVILIPGAILVRIVGRSARWPNVTVAVLEIVFVISSASGAAVGLFLSATLGPELWKTFSTELAPRRQEPTSAVKPVPELTVRDFLNPNETEPADLGLYSYLLFGSSGNSDYDRKIAAIRAYLSDFATYKETGRIGDWRTLNGFFVFTAEDLEWIDQCDREGFVHSKQDDPSSPMIPTWTCHEKGGRVKDHDLNDLAQIVVSKYGYQRASILLKRLMDLGCTKSINGIYIISYVNPVRKNSDLDVATVLVQDLSNLPPDYMESWVEITKTQFTKADYWDKDALEYAMLRIRTILAEAAPVVSVTETALASDLIKKIWPSDH